MSPPPAPRRITVGAEVALAVVAGVVSFACVSVVLAAVDSVVVVILLVPAVVAAVLVIAHRWGAAYAIPVAVLALVAYDWFQFPPTHPAEFPDRDNLLNLLAYLGVATLAGELAAFGARRARASEAERAALAGEQAALRRVATAVAQGASRETVFEGIAREVARLVPVEEILLLRYEDDEHAVVLATAKPDERFKVGSRHRLGGKNVATRVRESGASIRIDDLSDATGSIGQKARELSVRSAVGTPIVVAGRLWGVLITGTSRELPLPPDTQERVGDFTELMATAIANAESTARAALLADEQAALHRVATLVAKDAEPTEIFATVAHEAAALVGADCTLWRAEGEGTASVAAVHGSIAPTTFPPGTRIRLEGDGVTEQVLRDGRPRRIEDYGTRTGEAAEGAREIGVTSAVGHPVLVGGATWGALVVATFDRDERCPPETESRLAQFADLVGTAIANADSREALAASRARLVTAADEARRRVVRDLHDGAQQRLVHTIVTLTLAKQAIGDVDEPTRALLADALEQAERSNEELRELAHGILPSVLAHGGLRAGVDTLVARLALPVEVDIDDGRYAPEIEASAYFIIAEALTNVVKHAQAGHVDVHAHVRDGALLVEVEDDGVGGAAAEGHGLVGLADRATALGGLLRVESPARGGTTVSAALPLSGSPSAN